MSLYSLKKGAGGAVQPWSQVITLAEAGKGCDGLFGLYDSLGDKTLIGANTIATLLDGPEKVVRYGALTLGDGVTATSLTASQRCKGLVILCDTLTVKANATINMTGKGPRIVTNDDSFFPFDDYRIPFRISLASSRMMLAQALAVISEQGLAPWDRGTFQALVAAMFGFDLSVVLAGSLALMRVGGTTTPSGGVGGYTPNGGTVGGIGGAGQNGWPGGGGGGGANGDGYAAQGSYGRVATPLCGGAGGGGARCVSTSIYSPTGTLTSGAMHVSDPTLILPCEANPAVCTAGQTAGGGAGLPGGVGANGGGQGGNGVGGKLTIICRGAITVQTGGKIEANGMPGGNGMAAGGGSGGGQVFIISPVTASNFGTIQAAGGIGGTGATGGGPGGAGSVVTKLFSDMGW